ncbi:MAG: class I SAM-dependent methyltransferase [Sphingobacteriales bacterium]|nr:class I SAM-dependent methyltransferase [Sphingobacteriales bacterium]
MFKNRLTKVFRHLSKTARKQNVGCYRIYDHDLPEFPLIIDIYEDKTYVSEYKRKHGLEEEAHLYWLKTSVKTISEVTGIDEKNIFTKLRQRKAGRSGQYRKEDFSKNEFIITENGLKFIVNLSDYLDTGLFLDHRITRKMIMGEGDGKKVLNLFAYTGAFSVYAAAGSAKSVTTVDLSNTYINWAKRNFVLNGFVDEKKYRFVVADVMSFLKTVEKSSYDIIIMDPPTFSNSKKMEGILDIQRDHLELINDCMNILSPEGVLFFSTNFTKFEIDSSKINAGSIIDITKATTPFDFEGKLKRWCYKITEF